MGPAVHGAGSDPGAAWHGPARRFLLLTIVGTAAYFAAAGWVPAVRTSLQNASVAAFTEAAPRSRDPYWRGYHGLVDLGDGHVRVDHARDCSAVRSAAT